MSPPYVGGIQRQAWHPDRRRHATRCVGQDVNQRGTSTPLYKSDVRFSIGIPIASEDHDTTPTRWRDEITIWCLKGAVAITPQDLQQAIRAVTHRASNVEQAVAIVIGHEIGRAHV